MPLADRLVRAWAARNQKTASTATSTTIWTSHLSTLVFRQIGGRV